MLSNVGNHAKFIELNTVELSELQASLEKSYTSVFKACFKYTDLIEYFSEHAQISYFKSILRNNASYKVTVDTFHGKKELSPSDYQIIQAVSLFLRNIAPKLKEKFQEAQILLDDRHTSLSLFSTNALLDRFNSVKNMVLMTICNFSLLESFSREAKLFPTIYKEAIKNTGLFSYDSSIKSTLDKLIFKYLKLSSKSYDQTDFNRALRQAAFTGDAVAMKILTVTHRADINAVSPSKQSVFDYAKKNTDEQSRQLCINILSEAQLFQATGSQIETSSSFKH